MANFDNLVPHILYWETGTPPASLRGLTPEQQYAVAAKRGYANIPGDHGGATMCGVTLNTYTAYCRRKGYPRPTEARLRALPFAQWRDILKTTFWDRVRADDISDFWIAAAIVDWVWISGPGIIKRIQRLLGVTADGIVGPATLAAINARNPEVLLPRITAERCAHMRSIVRANPSQAKFLRGWLRRATSIAYGHFND